MRLWHICSSDFIVWFSNIDYSEFHSSLSNTAIVLLWKIKRDYAWNFYDMAQFLLTIWPDNTVTKMYIGNKWQSCCVLRCSSTIVCMHGLHFRHKSTSTIRILASYLDLQITISHQKKLIISQNKILLMWPWSLCHTDLDL